ncbi:MAG: hypothetical protein ABEJ24_03120 [Candidatus Magasanikbacteria bacterium]
MKKELSELAPTGFIFKNGKLYRKVKLTKREERLWNYKGTNIDAIKSFLWMKHAKSTVMNLLHLFTGSFIIACLFSMSLLIYFMGSVPGILGILGTFVGTTIFLALFSYSWHQLTNRMNYDYRLELKSTYWFGEPIVLVGPDSGELLEFIDEDPRRHKSENEINCIEERINYLERILNRLQNIDFDPTEERELVKTFRETQSRLKELKAKKTR